MADDLADVVDPWLDGFAVSRQVPVRRLGEVAEVEVAGESRRLELVLVEPSDDVLRAQARRLLAADDVWLTAFTPQPRRFVPPDGVVVLMADELLMTLDLAVPREPRRAVAARLELRPDGDRAFVTVSVDDVHAAEGQVGVTGTSATFDRIRTVEGFQRRGLGSAVMDALAGWAVGRGATTGVLAASVEGQALYTRLGWRPVGSLLTLAAAGTVRP